MGIVDVKSTLQKAAGSNFSISDVTLGYLDGGRQQELCFRCKNHSLGMTIVQRCILEGSENPIEAAARIGGGLAATGEN